MKRKEGMTNAGRIIFTFKKQKTIETDDLLFILNKVAAIMFKGEHSSFTMLLTKQFELDPCLLEKKEKNIIKQTFSHATIRYEEVAGIYQCEVQWRSYECLNCNCAFIDGILIYLLFALFMYIHQSHVLGFGFNLYCRCLDDN